MLIRSRVEMIFIFFFSIPPLAGVYLQSGLVPSHEMDIQWTNEVTASIYQVIGLGCRHLNVRKQQTKETGAGPSLIIGKVKKQKIGSIHEIPLNHEYECSWGKISKSLEFCLRLLMWNVKGLLLVGWGTLYREYQSPFLKLLLAKVYGLNCPSRPRFFCLLWCFNVIIL